MPAERGGGPIPSDHRPVKLLVSSIGCEISALGRGDLGEDGIVNPETAHTLWSHKGFRVGVL